MWYPPDPDEPTSEVYRLMPPQRESSQLREALDAAYGIGAADDREMAVPRRQWWRALAERARPTSRRAAGWVWGLATATLAVILGTLISAYLLSH